MDSFDVDKIESGQSVSKLEKPDSIWKEMWYALKENKAAMLGLIAVIFLLFLAIFGRLLMPYDPNYQDPSQVFQWPSSDHWFGTDNFGRDILSRILYGARTSLTVGISAVAISLILGTIFGAIAGYSGGKIDTAIMRIMDMMLAIPSILLAITFMAALGRGLDKAIIAIGIVSVPEYARIVRGCVLSVKENDYIQAARVVGNRDARIIFKHILPNVLSSIIVRTTLGISTAVLETAALGFLGLGEQPPFAEWGQMLGGSRTYMFTAPYTLVFPGIAITITVLAFNLLGDGLRDAIDPKSRK